MFKELAGRTLLVGLSLLFVVCSMGMGLLVSTVARTQVEALMFAFMIMLPSVLLSGFMFPRSEMPPGIYHGWMSLEPDTLLLSTASHVYNRDKPDEERIPAWA